MSNKKIVLIDNWFISALDYNNPYQAPELARKRLNGKVYGHPDFNSGDFVTTSQILDIDLAARKVETRNTTYLLGKAEWLYTRDVRENHYDLYTTMESAGLV